MRHYLFAALVLACNACGGDGGNAKPAANAGAGSGGTSGGSGSGASGSPNGGGGNTPSAGAAGTYVGMEPSPITVDPPMAFLDPGGSQTFKCKNKGADAECTWSVVGGDPNGTVSADGVYEAPASLGVAQVQAASKANPSDKGSAVAVVKSKTTGMVGVWENVTPREIKLNHSEFSNDNFGVQDIVVDPVRPSDLYAFVCHQGVWKSTDYGATWTGPINTGNGGDKVTAGKPWTAAIDLAKRDPSTPPTLFTAAGNAAVGVLRSLDGGKSWVAYETNNETAVKSAGNNDYYRNDAYSLDMDPYDNKHLILGFHSGGISESLDGGEHWTTVPTADGQGGSMYPFFIDTGDATGTGKNWVTIAQSGENAGTWHTTDGGKNWAKVGDFMHGHGGTQLLRAGPNTAYAPGDSAGVFKTTDGGKTWANISKTGSNAVFGTPSMLYSNYGWAIGAGDVDPGVQSTARASDTAWKVTPPPPGLNNGAKHVAVTFDGTHYIMVGGFWNTGIWRFIE